MSNISLMHPELILIVALGSLFYTYIGYPLVLLFLEGMLNVTRHNKSWLPRRNPSYTPTVSVIVVAHNEAQVIERRIVNLLKQDYPREQIEIIIASDGSDDDTIVIATKYCPNGVRVLDCQPKRGRALTHNDAAAIAAGKVLIFSDAETVFRPDFVRKAVAYLADKRYGCGSGELSFQAIGTIGDSESLYWRLEKHLRDLEYRVGLLPFASGGCLVIRKELFVPVPVHSDIDCWLPYKAVLKGYRIFYASDCVACDVTAGTTEAHYKKRMRGALHAMGGVINSMPSLILARRFKTVWVMVSHRLLRWLGGYAMIGVLLGNLFLVGPNQSFYNGLLLLQLGFYSIGVLAWVEDRLNKGQKWLPVRWHHTALSFILANLAFLEATIRLAKHDHIVSYDPVSHN